MEIVEGATEEELVAEVVRVLNAPPLDSNGYMRTQDVRQRLQEQGKSVGLEKARGAIRALMAQGRIERGWVKIIDMAGRYVSVPAYRMRDDRET